jgi:hypothetical protein
MLLLASLILLVSLDGVPAIADVPAVLEYLPCCRRSCSFASLLQCWRPIANVLSLSD